MYIYLYILCIYIHILLIFSICSSDTCKAFVYLLAEVHGLQDLSSLTRDWTWVTSVKALNPHHWTTRELCVKLLLCSRNWGSRYPLNTFLIVWCVNIAHPQLLEGLPNFLCVWLFCGRLLIIQGSPVFRSVMILSLHCTRNSSFLESSHICVCIYIYIYTHMCMCIYIYIHTHVCVCVCIYIYIYTCVCVYTYIFLSVVEAVSPSLLKYYWYKYV